MGKMLRRHAGRDRRAASRVGKVAHHRLLPRRLDRVPRGRAGSTACRLRIGYYGGMIAKNADEKPKVPTMLHFGETDHSIPMTDVEIVKQKRPDVRNLRLSGRPRLLLRRARQLPRGEPQAGARAHARPAQEVRRLIVQAGRAPRRDVRSRTTEQLARFFMAHVRQRTGVRSAGNAARTSARRP